jgi:hypothetical protein
MAALILQLIFAILFALFTVALAALGTGLASVGYSTGYVSYLEQVGTVGTVLGVILSVIGYQFVYRRVRAVDYAAASPWALALSALGILTSIVPGILWFLAWRKIRAARIELDQTPAGARTIPAYSLASPHTLDASGTAYTSNTGAVRPPPPPPPPEAPACPRCRQPATWIPQYGRYFCYRCSQYV